jgi:opacity protein-like surface antigen
MHERKPMIGGDQPTHGSDARAAEASSSEGKAGDRPAPLATARALRLRPHPIRRVPKPRMTGLLDLQAAPCSRASFTLPAMTAGIGGEWMFAPNWSVFAEWNYIWIEDDAAQHFTPSPGLVGETLNTRQRAQTALVGVNYKFHWDGPVVAKY